MSAMDAGFNWSVPVDHPAFAGHFPGHPVVPGVVLLDQALLGICKAVGWPEAPCQIAACKFLSPVEPGESLRFSYQVQPNGSLNFEIAGNGRLVATGKLKSPDTVAR
jgi:3-hydroxymyristoyl/3-hydroxydecanoyl-(acyl carrier protein) dehydratase